MHPRFNVIEYRDENTGGYYYKLLINVAGWADAYSPKTKAVYALRLAGPLQRIKFDTAEGAEKAVKEFDRTLEYKIHRIVVGHIL